MRALIAFAALALTARAADDKSKSNQEVINRVHEARTVFQEIMATPNKSIPEDLLDKAYCVAIVPGVKKAAFIVGGKYGKGVLLCRDTNKTGWAGPACIRIEGGTFGLQIGAGETDLVLLVMNQRGADKLMKSEFTIGGGAEAMAGPVGRTAEAQTDALMHAEILSWSRSRGLLGGIALTGATLREDKNDNSVLYGTPFGTEYILTGDLKLKSPVPDAQALIGLLSRYSFKEK
jgi:lipid-binding SYLF domain-containing protein